MDMDIGQAMAALKAGQSMQRRGWNGKGMRIYLQDGYTNNFGQPHESRVEPVICIYTAQGTHQPGWLASQADLLADDWQVAR